jgi:hypothetical protein
VAAYALEAMTSARETGTDNEAFGSDFLTWGDAAEGRGPADLPAHPCRRTIQSAGAYAHRLAKPSRAVGFVRQPPEREFDKGAVVSYVV